MRILEIIHQGVESMGPYMARSKAGRIAYQFPDTPEANAEADRLERHKGMTEVDASSLGPKDKIIEVDPRWVPALPEPKPEGEG